MAIFEFLAQDSEPNLSSASHALEGSSNVAPLGDMVLTPFLALLFREPNANEAEARVFHFLFLLLGGHEQVLRGMRRVPGPDLLSKSTVRHKHGHGEGLASHGTGRMTCQPFEDGLALKAESLDAHQRIAHDLSSDGTEKVVGDLDFLLDWGHGGEMTLVPLYECCCCWNYGIDESERRIRASFADVGSPIKKKICQDREEGF
jgi:hypothetical protein